MAETIYRSAITSEMERRKAYLEAVPGFRLKEDLEALNRCSYTFGTQDLPPPETRTVITAWFADS